MATHGDFNPAVCGQAMLFLMPFVIVPMASGVATLLTLVGLLPCVPQHVPLEVHALVATVVAYSALKRLGT